MDAKKKRYILFAVIGILLLFVLNYSPINLYLSRGEHNFNSVISHSTHEMYKLSEIKDIGIVVNNPDDNLERRMAESLSDYLKQAGYTNVYILGSGLIKNLKLDFIIKPDFQTNISYTPFYKPANINYKFQSYNFLVAPDRYLDYNIQHGYNGTNKITYKGLISRKKALDILIDEAARSYVENFYKSMQKAIYDIDFAQVNLNEKKNGFWVNFNWFDNLFKKDDLREGQKISKYKDWIPSENRNVTIYQYPQYLDKVYIKLEAKDSLAVLMDFFSDLVEDINKKNYIDNNYSWYGSRSGESLRYYSPNQEVDITIDYKKNNQDVGIYSFDDNDTQEIELEWKQIDIIINKKNESMNIANNFLRGIDKENNLYQTTIEELAKVENKDPFYYLALYQVKLQRLKKEYWQQGYFNEELKNDIINIIEKFQHYNEPYNEFPGIYNYYMGEFYLELANISHDNYLLELAQKNFLEVRQTNWSKGFNPGAEKRLEEILQLPYADKKDYDRVLAGIHNYDLNKRKQVKIKVFMKQGKYEEAKKALGEYISNYDQYLNILIHAKLNNSIEKISLDKSRLSSSAELKHKLSKVIAYYSLEEDEKAETILDEVKQNFSDWYIKEIANNIYLETGVMFRLSKHEVTQSPQLYHRMETLQAAFNKNNFRNYCCIIIIS